MDFHAGTDHQETGANGDSAERDESHRLASSQRQPRLFNEQDWATNQATISTMYAKDDKKVKEVREFMKRQYGLLATEKMYKDRFKSWGLSKNLQPDEVLALLRIERSRDTVGIHVNFWRYGKHISSAKLKRYLEDHPHLKTKLARVVYDERQIDHLIESYLPRRGLVALSSNPSKGIRAEDALHITESALYPLKLFGDSSVGWKYQIVKPPASVYLINEALVNCDLMRPNQLTRKTAWCLIHLACENMWEDIVGMPDAFVLYFPWVLRHKSFAGYASRNMPDLSYQLLRYACELFTLSLGPGHPYTVLFAAAAKLTDGTCNFTLARFARCVSEALIDIVSTRLEPVQGNLSYSQRFLDKARINAMLEQQELQAGLPFFAHTVVPAGGGFLLFTGDNEG